MSEFAGMTPAQRLRVAASLLEDDRVSAALELIQGVLAERDDAVPMFERKICGCVMAKAWACRAHPREPRRCAPVMEAHGYVAQPVR